MGIGRLVRVGMTVGVVAVLATAGTGSAAAGSAVAAGLLAPGCTAQPVIRDLPWAQRMMQPERVWPFSTGRGVTVAVLDSGVDTTHPQLKDKVRPGEDYVKQAVNSCVTHGTEVTGIIVAKSAGGVGFRGLAPDAEVLPIRVSDRGPGDSNPAVTPAQLAAAIRKAAEKAKVINISLVLYNDEPAIRDAIAEVVAKDVVVVAAVGNGHTSDDPNVTDRTPYPAAYPGVLGVGAITEAGLRVPQSQVGSYVDIVAPGADVITTAPVGGHVKVSGTSYAAPFVAAAAALVRAARPGMKAADVAYWLQVTATPSAGGAGSRQYGAGIVNPYRAVTEISQGARPSPLPSAAMHEVDPAAEARAAAWQRTTRFALTAAAWALAAVALVLLAATVVRHGRRRGWRPGRAALPTEHPPGPPAPPGGTLSGRGVT